MSAWQLAVVFAISLCRMATTSSSPLIVGLNSALQRTLGLPCVVPGSVNRATELEIGIGGKGQNAQLAASIMSKASPRLPTCSLVQFIGQGFEGDQLLSLQDNKGMLTIGTTIRSAGRCRTCFTLLDQASDEATEIIEPSETVSEMDVENLLETLKYKYRKEKAPGIAIMGRCVTIKSHTLQKTYLSFSFTLYLYSILYYYISSHSMPPGCSTDLYAQIIGISCNSWSKVVIDSLVGLPEMLTTCASIGCEDVLLKVNARELCKIANVDIENILAQSESVACIPTEMVKQAASKLFADFEALTYIATTDGPFPATFVSKSGEGSCTINTPVLPRPLVSPIGAGDTVSAGTLSYWSSSAGSDAGEALGAFQWGMSCASASCMNAGNAIFTIDDASAIRSTLGTIPIPTGSSSSSSSNTNYSAS